MSWLIYAGAVVVVMAGFAVVQNMRFPRTGRDPQQRFSEAEQAEILRRAGVRCEHHWFGSRCDATADLTGVHFIPWFRGGRTSVANGIALCRRHAWTKNFRIPTRIDLERLARRRAVY